MLRMVQLAVAAAVVGMSKAAWAVVLMGSFAGTLYDGTDGQGLFGPPGGDLTNAAIAGTYRYDTDLLTVGVSGPVVSGTGQNGALALTLTINGQSFTFDDSMGSSVAFDASTGELDLALSGGAGGEYNAFTLGVVPASNAATGLGLAPEFPAGDLAVSLGSFIIAGSDATNGDFTVSSISQSGRTAVPEPGSLAVLLPLALWLAVRRMSGAG